MSKKSIIAYKKAKKVIPGGVNSPVRAFRNVGSNPIFFKKGKGSKMYDIDGNYENYGTPLQINSNYTGNYADCVGILFLFSIMNVDLREGLQDSYLIDLLPLH